MGNLGLEIQIGVCVVAVVRNEQRKFVLDTNDIPHDHFEGSLKKRTKRKPTYSGLMTRDVRSHMHMPTHV